MTVDKREVISALMTLYCRLFLFLSSATLFVSNSIAQVTAQASDIGVAPIDDSQFETDVNKHYGSLNAWNEANSSLQFSGATPSGGNPWQDLVTGCKPYPVVVDAVNNADANLYGSHSVSSILNQAKTSITSGLIRAQGAQTPVQAAFANIGTAGTKPIAAAAVNAKQAYLDAKQSFDQCAAQAVESQNKAESIYGELKNLLSSGTLQEPCRKFLSPFIGEGVDGTLPDDKDAYPMAKLNKSLKKLNEFCVEEGKAFEKLAGNSNLGENLAFFTTGDPNKEDYTKGVDLSKFSLRSDSLGASTDAVNTKGVAANAPSFASSHKERALSAAFPQNELQSEFVDSGKLLSVSERLTRTLCSRTGMRCESLESAERLRSDAMKDAKIQTVTQSRPVLN